MTTARQVIRWAIPGWCLFGLFYLFVIMRVVLLAMVARTPVPLGIQLPTEGGALMPAGGESFTNVAVWLFFFGAAGIPAGFAIYQLYFWWYWRVSRVPFVPGAIVPTDRGREVLGEIDGMAEALEDQLGLELHATPEPRQWVWRLFRRRFFHYFAPWVRIIRPAPASDLARRRLELLYQHNWYLALFVWHWAIGDNPAKDYLAGELSHLLDIYHALGCVRMALLVAYPSYLVYDFLLNPVAPFHNTSWICIPLTLFVSFVAGCFLFKGLTTNRRRTLHESIRFMRFVIQTAWRNRNRQFVPLSRHGERNMRVWPR